MSDHTPTPAHVFTVLRDRLFHGDLAARAPAPPGSPTSEAGLEVIGVVMEEGLDTGSYLVFGLRDGTASVYYSTGGGSVGGQGRPHIHAAAKQLVQAALPFVTKLAPVDEYPVPTTGRVRFSILTSEGVRVTEIEETELTRGRSELSPLFDAAHQLIRGFRLADEQEPEPSDEVGYVNCLLTTLASGTATSVTLTEGVPPPDPANWTDDCDDLEWIAGIGFDLDRLSSEEIIHVLLEMAQFGWFGLANQGDIQTKLATDGGTTLRDVAFRVRRRRRGRSSNELEISLIRPPG